MGVSAPWRPPWCTGHWRPPWCNFVQFSWLGAWARCAPWAARVSAEGLNRWPLAKLRRCNCAVQQRKPSRLPRALEGGTDALPATLLRHPPNPLHGTRAFKCPAPGKYQVWLSRRGGSGGCARAHEEGGFQPVREEAEEVDTDRDTSGCQVGGGKKKINKRQRPPPFLP